MNDNNNESCALVIFGASGDLTQRMLVPALFNLEKKQLMPKDVRIIGLGRTKYSDEQFHSHLHDALEAEGVLVDPALWPKFAERLSYLSGGYDNPRTYQELGERLKQMDDQFGTRQNRLFYLAIPPEVYGKVIRSLGEAGLNHSDGWVRIIIEKPFGHDLESARALNAEVHRYFNELQVYRIDHFLGKETVQNILAFRFANYIFQEVWSNKYIDYIQITAAEREGVGHRAGYYEHSGVVRDMLQNHILQLVSLIAMEPPMSIDADDLRDEKVKVLKAIRPLQLDQSVWGQYQGYRGEPDIAPDSNTPTFIALKLCIDNWRWQGVPFFLRTGKAMEKKSTEIMIQFKVVPNPIFPGEDHSMPDRLGFCIQPNEGIHLCFDMKTPGMGMTVTPVSMNFNYSDLIGSRSLPDAYERLLLDAVQGDAALFARSDEIEHAWKLVDGLLRPWEAMKMPPLHVYPQGSWGPQQAEMLIREDGHKWINCC